MRELAAVSGTGKAFDRIAEERAELLVDQHERYRRALGSGWGTAARYRAVEPVLPMDLMGIYILLPPAGGQA